MSAVLSKVALNPDIGLPDCLKKMNKVVKKNYMFRFSNMNTERVSMERES
jgi:hypothetical protein